MMPRRLIWLILLLALLIRLPSLFISHIENDEIIYQTLTKKVAKKFSLNDYTLRGEAILADLPKDLYDTALFLRPPGFILISSLFWGLSKGMAAVLMLVPIMGALISIAAIYKIGELLNDEAVGLMSAMILAVEPVLLFSSTKFWTDGWLTGLMTLAMLFLVQAVKTGKILDWVVSSFFTFLAILTKYSAGLLLPIALFIMAVNISRFWKISVWFLIIFLLFGCWWRYYYLQTGMLYPTAGKPNQEAINNFPFVAMVVERPIYYYFKQLAITSPLIGLGLAVSVYQLIRKRKWSVGLVWGGIIMMGLTWYGATGGSYQMRYIAPAMPPLALLTGQQRWFKTNFGQAILLFGLAIGLAIGLLNSYVYPVADIISTFQLK